MATLSSALGAFGTPVAAAKSTTASDDQTWSREGAQHAHLKPSQRDQCKIADAEEEHGTLIQQVKDVQKTGPEARTQWRDYCDIYGGGTRDPRLHPADFLRGFFDLRAQHNLPIATTPLHERPLPGYKCNGLEAHTILVAKVKHGQRRSLAFNEAWIDYCRRSSYGIFDPQEHHCDSLRSFLLSSAPGAETKPKGDPFASRAPFEPSAFSRCIRVMQSSRMKWKRQWDEHCDNYGDGVRDPDRHPQEFLEGFVAMVAPQGSIALLLQEPNVDPVPLKAGGLQPGRSASYLSQSVTSPPVTAAEQPAIFSALPSSLTCGGPTLESPQLRYISPMTHAL